MGMQELLEALASMIREENHSDSAMITISEEQFTETAQWFGYQDSGITLETILGLLRRSYGLDSFPLQRGADGQWKAIFWDSAVLEKELARVHLTPTEKVAAGRRTYASQAEDIDIRTIVGNWKHRVDFTRFLASNESKVSLASVLGVHLVLSNYYLATVGFTPLSTNRISLMTGLSQQQTRRAITVLEGAGYWLPIHGKKRANPLWHVCGDAAYIPTFTIRGEHLAHKLAAQ